MEGQALNETYDYSDAFSMKLTREEKGKSYKGDS